MKEHLRPAVLPGCLTYFLSSGWAAEAFAGVLIYAGVLVWLCTQGVRRKQNLEPYTPIEPWTSDLH